MPEEREFRQTVGHACQDPSHLLGYDSSPDWIVIGTIYLVLGKLTKSFCWDLLCSINYMAKPIWLTCTSSHWPYFGSYLGVRVEMLHFDTHCWFHKKFHHSAPQMGILLSSSKLGPIYWTNATLLATTQDLAKVTLAIVWFLWCYKEQHSVMPI